MMLSTSQGYTNLSVLASSVRRKEVSQPVLITGLNDCLHVYGHYETDCQSKLVHFFVKIKNVTSFSLADLKVAINTSGNLVKSACLVSHIALISPR